MGRRGSISFVIEVKRSKRRFALPSARTDDPSGKGDVRFGAVNPAGFAAPPFSEGPRGYDPTVEAAKLAADRLFNRLGGSESTPLPAWSDLGAQGNNVAPAQQAAGIPLPERDVSTTPSTAAPQVAHPRTGRVLESLTSVNPLEALFRQKAEEHAIRQRRPRTARSTTAGETQVGVRSDSKQGSASKSAAAPTGVVESVVDTGDANEPKRVRNQSRRKIGARRVTKRLGNRSVRKRKSAGKSRRWAAAPVRASKRLGGAKRNVRSGTKASVGRKHRATKNGVHKVPTKKPATGKATARKTAIRKAAKASKLRKTPTKRAASRGRAATRGRRSR
jgi:hypothetical protein